MANYVTRCVTTVQELIRADNVDADKVQELLSFLMLHVGKKMVYATINECAHHGFVARPLCDTYKCIKANPSYLFQSIFSTVRDWGDVDVVGDMTSSADYSYTRIKHLRCAVQTCALRTGLVQYVQRAMLLYASYVNAPWRYVSTVERWTMNDVLIIACKVDACHLNVEHTLTLAAFHPKLGTKLVWRLVKDSTTRVLEQALYQVLCLLSSREVDAWTDRILWKLSRAAPERVADAMVADVKFFKLTLSVSTACMWNMVPYLKRNVHVDARPVQELFDVDLARAVAAGVFTDCCVMGTAEWPTWTPILHQSTPDHVVYDMAAYGRIRSSDLHVFAKIPDVVVDTLLRQDGCWPKLHGCVQRARNWLRRAAWMMTLSKFRKRIDTHSCTVDAVCEALRSLTAIQALNEMIMAYV